MKQKMTPASVFGGWVHAAMCVFLGSQCGFWLGLAIAIAVSLLLLCGYWLARKEAKEAPDSC